MLGTSNTCTAGSQSRSSTSVSAMGAMGTMSALSTIATDLTGRVVSVVTIRIDSRISLVHEVGAANHKC